MNMFDADSQFLLMTDIDDSLYSVRVRARELAELHAFCSRTFDIVYLTGRTYEQTMDMINHKKIPSPKLVFADLGVTVFRDGATLKNPLLRNNISIAARRHILAVAERCPSLESQVIARNRLSFRLMKRDFSAEQAITAMRRGRVDIYVSQNYVDVLPKGVNKGTCAEWVIRNCAKAYAAIVLVGDSENDLYLSTGYNALNVVKFLISPRKIRDVFPNVHDIHHVRRIEDLRSEIVRAMKAIGCTIRLAVRGPQRQ